MVTAGSPVKDIPTEIQRACDALKVEVKTLPNHPNIETMVLQVGG
jgi:hypothetical protein